MKRGEEPIVFFRYASLYFCAAVDKDENELIVLELIHRYVELLDKYFGSVKTAISHNNQFERITGFRSANWTLYSILKRLVRILRTTSDAFVF